jgi:hypothetical protein
MKLSLILFAFFSLAYSDTIPKEKTIAYIFIGHSNLTGICGDSSQEISNPRTWLYSFTSKRLYHGNYGKNATVVVPFLDEMALRYPEYNFVGVKVDKIGGSIKNFLPGNEMFDKTKSAIETLGAMKIKIGGVLSMLSYIVTPQSGGDLTSKRLDALMIVFMDAVEKEIFKNIVYPDNNRPSHIPFICGNYVFNFYDPGDSNFRPNSRQKPESQIETLRPRSKACPILNIPVEYFCDDNHFRSFGYRIWAEDAAMLIQENNFDFWYNPQP